MKFTKINDGQYVLAERLAAEDKTVHPDYKTIWVTEDRSRVIVLYNLPSSVWSGSKVSVAVCVHLSKYKSAFGSVNCKSDGVSAFVVKEVMDISDALEHSGKPNMFKAWVMNFFSWMEPEANLRIFQAYKKEPWQL